MFLFLNIFRVFLLYFLILNDFSVFLKIFIFLFFCFKGKKDIEDKLQEKKRIIEGERILLSLGLAPELSLRYRFGQKYTSMHFCSNRYRGVRDARTKAKTKVSWEIIRIFSIELDISTESLHGKKILLVQTLLKKKELNLIV